jgi:hypothetical protein
MVKNKYGARKVTAPDGQVFDSQREYTRWCELKLMERAGLIADLKRQVKFVLIPSQKDAMGKTIEKECSYWADFVYFDHATRQIVVEDAKGMKTEVYKIKKKLVLHKYGIRIKEV